VENGSSGVHYYCFAGCDLGDILDVLRRRGLIDDRRGKRRDRQLAPVPPFRQDPDPAALQIWLAAAPAPGSVVESYLRHRGITLPPPPSLRCGTRQHLDRYPMPAMIAAVQRPDGKVVAVQSTLLTSAGRKACVSTSRINTGALGAGAVRLGKATDVLGLAEGVETALSAMQMTNVPMWACLGVSRMHRVELPETVRELHLFGDNDDPGRCAVEGLQALHSGAPNKSGISRINMSLGKRSRDSQERLHARRPFKCDADVVKLARESAVAQLCPPSCSLFLAQLFSTHDAHLSAPRDCRPDGVGPEACHQGQCRGGNRASQRTASWSRGSAWNGPSQNLLTSP